MTFRLDLASKRSRKYAVVVEYSLISVMTLIALLTTLINMAFLREVNYNEGWNIYNAVAYRNHTLYPHQLGWTSNNYPMLSFVTMDALQRFTHDYLFTGRVLSFVSLIVLSWAIYRICKAVDCTARASVFAALFCFALFSLNTAGSYAAALYVGANDPTMLGLAVSSLALLVYVTVTCPRKSLPVESGVLS